MNGYIVIDRERVKQYEDNTARLVEMKFKGSHKEKRKPSLDFGSSMFAPLAFAIKVIVYRIIRVCYIASFKLKI